MNISIKILFILTIWSCTPCITLAAATHSTSVAGTLALNPLSKNSVHFIGMIVTPTQFTNTIPLATGAGTSSENLVGFAVSPYYTPPKGPDVPTFSSDLVGGSSSPKGFITVPYTGNYRIGGTLIYYQTISSITNLCLTVQVTGKGGYPSGSSCYLTLGSKNGARTSLDLGNYLQASNVALTKGDTLFIWSWTAANTLYVLPGSYISLDSVD